MSFIMKRLSHLRIVVLSSLAVVAGGVLVFCDLSTAAAGRPGFANASLSGLYALRGTGGANEAASVGVTTFDGAGKATRSLVLNAAVPEGRAISTITSTGTYSVNADGTGTAVFANTLPDSSTVTFSFDFVIRQVTAAVPGRPLLWRESLLATDVFLMQREPGLAAQLVTFELTRLGDG